MLEQIAYESQRRKQEQIVYQVGDLEFLSASALYYGTGSSSGSSSGSGGSFFSGFNGKAPSGGDPKPSLFGFNGKAPSGGSSKPSLIGTYSKFQKASDYGIGPGIAKETEGFIERYRAGKHENYGEDHVNLEIYSPVDIFGKKKRINPLLNIHINLNSDE